MASRAPGAASLVSVARQVLLPAAGSRTRLRSGFALTFSGTCHVTDTSTGSSVRFSILRLTGRGLPATISGSESRSSTARTRPKSYANW